MNKAHKVEEHEEEAFVPFQEASLDIWDKKYRLTAKDGSAVDHSMDDTYRRVAKALAEVEAPEARAATAETAEEAERAARAERAERAKVSFWQRTRRGGTKADAAPVASSPE